MVLGWEAVPHGSEGVVVAHPTVWVLIDPDTLRIVAGNVAARQLYGWQPDDAGAAGWVDGQVVAEVVTAANERRSHVEAAFVLASGELREVELSVGRVEVDGRELFAAVIQDAVRSRQADLRALESEAFARSIVAGAPVGIAVADLDGRLVQVNPALCRLLGRDEHELLGVAYLSLTHPDDRAASIAAVQRMHAGQASSFEVEKRYLRKDGSVAVANVAGGLLRDATGQPTHRLAFIEDVTEHRATEQRAELYRRRLAASERRFEALVEHATDLIIVVREDGTIAYATPTTRAFLGLDTDVSVERLTRHVVDDDLADAFAAWEQVLAAPDELVTTVIRAGRADGQTRQLAVTMTNLCAVETVRGIVINARDMTDEYEARARLEHQAGHDALTGLANRPALLARLGEIAADGRVGQRQAYGLALLDLDAMAGVNDRLGHHVGDFLLRSVAARLAELVADRGTVARTSGDEFAVLMPGIDDLQAGLELGTQLQQVFDAPYRTPGGAAIRLTARVGVALARDTSSTTTALLQDADLALTDAREGAGRVVVCDQQLRARQQRRLTLQHDLTLPMITDQLRLEYQPVVELATGRPVGLEALLRWDHPNYGAISPEEFIPLAEQTGAITPIGSWALEQACCQLATWSSSQPRADSLHMSVNVSARQLLDVAFAATVEHALNFCALGPDRLWLEVTETALADAEQLLPALTAIRRLGVRIHIDDFGTGYSSLAQLRELPFDGLKIDRSFIEPVGRNRQAEAMVAAIRTIAAIRNLRVVAEGVETDLQRDTLHHLGCPWAQGYLWSPPRPAAQLPDVVDRLHQHPPGESRPSTYRGGTLRG
jgi:diguanylate cyclase (GGDEF)-like protein/PAS domain S-box-containing protein